LLIGVRAPTADERAAADWIAANCTLAGGALSVRPHGGFVSGYFGNVAASGLAASGLDSKVVREWMQWYVQNAHDSASGVDGVPDDRTMLGDGSVRLRGRPDSTDAYGATFLILARLAYASGDPNARAFLRAHHSDILRIARSIVATQQADGLTFARPQHRIAYAIDNAQAYRGLLEGANLMQQAYGDASSSRWMRERAIAVAAGMESRLWDPVTQTYRPQGAGRNAPAANLAIAYPDALAQAYAVYYGVVDPRSARAASLLARAAPALGAGEVEHRLVIALARRASGAPPPRMPFAPPPLCADAGWYLLLQARD